jgi:hypothetical protein
MLESRFLKLCDGALHRPRAYLNDLGYALDRQELDGAIRPGPVRNLAQHGLDRAVAAGLLLRPC